MGTYVLGLPSRYRYRRSIGYGWIGTAVHCLSLRYWGGAGR